MVGKSFRRHWKVLEFYTNLPVLTLTLRMCEFVFNVPPTAKVIWTQGHGLEFHLTDWRSWGSNSGPLGTRRVYKKTNCDSCLLHCPATARDQIQHLLTCQKASRNCHHLLFLACGNKSLSYEPNYATYQTLYGKQCRSWSTSFWRSWLIWIHTVCKEAWI